MTGLSSSSAICARSSAIWETRSSTLLTEVRSAPDAPGRPSRIRRTHRADQVVGVGFGQRSEPGGAVRQDVGSGSGQPEQHQRAEHLLLKELMVTFPRR